MNLLWLAEAEYRYRPFVTPAPVWDYWYVFLIPLCLGISIVYKSVKCGEMKNVPREATLLFLQIMVVLALAGAGLAVLVALLAWK